MSDINGKIITIIHNRLHTNTRYHYQLSENKRIAKIWYNIK